MLEGRTVPEKKQKLVSEFKKLIEESDVIGVVNLQNLPARQLQNMRETLREKVVLRMAKKRLVRIAIGNSKKSNIKELEQYMKGMPAMLFTDQNPFTLFATLKKNKSKAPIKAGQEAPNDIVIPAGPTSFAPGPIIGELGALGIPSGVEGGKVAVKKDTVIAKEGQTVNAQVASLLSRMGIEPMEIGLDLVAVWEKGEILTKKILDIDTDEYAVNFRDAASWAFNLAMHSGYVTQDTVMPLLSKAHYDALALATSEDILTDETVKNVLAKAESQMSSLKSRLNLSETAEASKMDKKPEEKPPEESEVEPKPVESKEKKEEPGESTGSSSQEPEENSRASEEKSS